MKRSTIKLLLLLTLIVGFSIAPATLFGSVNSTTSLTSPSSRAAQKKLARKVAAMALLREYLPQYADILEARTMRFEEIFYNASAIVPISYPFDTRSPFANPAMRLQLLSSIERWLGTPYRYGGRSAAGFDCSGFVRTVVDQALGQSIGNSSSAQSKEFAPIYSVDSLQFGDLMFFSGTRRSSKRIGHVGIYLGNGVFAHSSTSIGVTFNHITDGYYQKRFRWGGRFTSVQVADADRSGVYVNP